MKSVASNTDNTECILWPFARCRTRGYGRAKLNGVKMNAHRAVLVLSTNEDPPDKVAAHGECHNPLCVNPLHLTWATPRENQRDRIRDGTKSLGSRHGCAKLNESQIPAIRNDPRILKEIAADYGVTLQAIYNVKIRKTWRCVP